MAQSTFRHARITGISAVVPKEEVRIMDELPYFGGDAKKAVRMTRMVGIDRRRLADEGVTSADLCQQAAENLFDGMGLDRSGVDTLIFISQYPDHILPATACILQHKLRLSRNCAAFDVSQGCTAYTYGLWLSFSLVESGAARQVLLLVGEGMSRLQDRDNRIVAPVFGDCGTATLIGHSPDETASWFELGTDGSGAEALMVPAGRARIPMPDTPEEYAAYCERIFDRNGTPWRLTRTYMDGGAIFDFTLSVVPDHLHSLMQYAGQTRDDIDKLVLHQANRQIMQALTLKSGFPLEKSLMETFSRYGNGAGASIPAAICEELAGDVREKKLRVLLSGFGVGLSWTSAVLDLDHIWCSGMRDYDTPANHPVPAGILARWRKKIQGE